MDTATAPALNVDQELLAPATPRRVSAPDPMVHFGGPDRPAHALRDLLQERVDAVAPGGSIDWMTYYFRDEALANALVRAHRRGVKVRVCMEGRPRLGSANDRVISRLANGLGPGLRVVKHLLPLHLHSKIYCFSDPRPTALVGSFNPSGTQRTPDWVISDIGDQDRGHNLLIELNDPALVSRFAGRVALLHASGGEFSRPLRLADAEIIQGDLEAMFFPCFAPNPLIGKLEALAPGSSVRIAASHVRDPFVARSLAALVRRDVHVTLLTGHTMRRTPRRTERFLLRHGVKVLRFVHRDELPMHSKFILAEGSGVRWCSFGSYNLTLTSRWLNHELLMFSRNEQLWDSLDRRWWEIAAQSGS